MKRQRGMGGLKRKRQRQRQRNLFCLSLSFWVEEEEAEAEAEAERGRIEEVLCLTGFFAHLLTLTKPYQTRKPAPLSLTREWCWSKAKFRQRV